MGKYLRTEKKIVKYLNALFFVKEGFNDKNLDIILFAYSRRVQNFLFHCSRLKDT